ncbi:MAG: hypothetical protein F4Y04_05745 [Chloroflexi bacterium]|nr:hypothetical protein [Chloroflexota bacterium]
MIKFRSALWKGLLAAMLLIEGVTVLALVVYGLEHLDGFPDELLIVAGLGYAFRSVNRALDILMDDLRRRQREEKERA